MDGRIKCLLLAILVASFNYSCFPNLQWMLALIDEQTVGMC